MCLCLFARPSERISCLCVGFIMGFLLIFLCHWEHSFHPSFFAVGVIHMIFLSFGWLISRESVLHYEGFTRRRPMRLNWS